MSNNNQDKTKKHKRNNRRFLRELKRNPELLELEQTDENTDENEDEFWLEEFKEAA